jgi:energy-coupling factor transporter ATP-binding protein EcfA2
MAEIKNTLKKAELIAFANHKGGTGKTTSCISIAGFLAREAGSVRHLCTERDREYTRRDISDSSP